MRDGVEAGLQEYEKIKTTHPDRVDNNTLGYVAFLLTLDKTLTPERLEAAYRLFEHNIALFPDYRITQRNYAETLAMGGRAEDARTMVNKIRREAPDQAGDLLEEEFFRRYGTQVKEQ